VAGTNCIGLFCSNFFLFFALNNGLFKIGCCLSALAAADAFPPSASFLILAAIIFA
jgi:hypothetical protein